MTTIHLDSDWLTRATYSDGYLTLTMRGIDYTYRSPSWMPGVLAGWSAQGASVGSLWHKVKHFCERVEGEAVTMDLTATLEASIAATRAGRTAITDADGSTLGYVEPARNAFGKRVLYGYWTLDATRPPQAIKDRRWNREFRSVEDATTYMRAWAAPIAAAI